jgi:hypothetical protein
VFLRNAAVALAVVGVAALPSVVSAGAGGNSGTLTVEVDVTGDPGGDPAAVSFVAVRNTDGGNNDTVVSATGSVSQSFTLDQGAYNFSASVSDPAYVITSTGCVEQPPGQGPGQPTFVITGGGSVLCTVVVAYTAPPVTTAPTDTTTPTDTSTPEVTDPGVTTTTVDQAVLPPGGGGATTTGTIPVTGPTDETLAIVLTALGALMLGGGAVTIARRH